MIRRTLSTPGAIVAWLFLVIAGAAALSIDVPRDAYSPKGDESTYVGMALSLAYDGDVRFEARDLQRFWQLYGVGPEGLFLNRGAPWVPHLTGRPPFVAIEHTSTDAHGVERLYFAKAFLYAVAGAPFVRLAGLNGLLLMNVVLLALVLWAGIEMLRVRSTPLAAILFTSAFVCGSAVLVYGAWLTPEVLNFAGVFLAYWLWCTYGSARPADAGRSDSSSRARWADIAAVALIGLMAYSKPPYAALACPMVLLPLWRRRLVPAVALGLVGVVVVGGAFGVHALVSGEANYQGGDRKTFYGGVGFPFEAGRTFDTSGDARATDENNTNEGIFPRQFWPRLGLNVEYFLVGRHFGLVPYGFPAIVALGAFVWRRRWREASAVLTMAGIAIVAGFLLIWLPFSWSGGGGPTGNRYFIAGYAAMFFLAGPIVSTRAAIVAWIGSAAFIAHILVNPLYAAKATWVTSQRGLLRALPVELTMSRDLPVNLVQSRSRIEHTFGGVTSFLYLLDDNVYPPEASGFWVRGGARADIVVRTDQQASTLRVSLESPIANRVRLNAGSGTTTVAIDAGVRQEVLVPAKSVVSTEQGTFALRLSIEPSSAFVPRLRDSASTDERVLGVLVNVAPLARVRIDR
ncbi:MAG TPA: hypothetical protein VHB78_17895 [Vicinamibacterales bacterium]|nr:hypothetical protein [Vicinamibacterales bacterium]